MRRQVLAFFGLLIAVGGCATPETPTEIRYVPPAEPSSAAREVRIPQPHGMVWSQLLERLNASPLTVERIDQPSGLIVTTYSGDAEPYLDCGWIMTYGAQDLVRTPAAAREATFSWRAQGGRLSVKRNLTLDGRFVIQVRPAGADTVLSVDSTYVVTKVLEVDAAAAGAPGGSHEIISFTGGEEGRFTKGTVCRPTGKLELLATSAVAAGGATRSAAAGTQPQLDCAGADATYCEALALIEPYEQQSGLSVRTVGGAILYDGQPLRFDITFPGFDSFLHVAYIQRGGLVGNVLPGHGRVWPANAENFVEETGYNISEPYGVELIVALATAEPLFASPRPEFEPAETFLSALRERLAALEASGSDTQIVASHFVVRIEPRGGVVSASY